jgi:poly-gamma-glutamate synthesis protein (capsule biosynthesis protein)
VVQPVKMERVGGREVLVAYSLGNFISNQQQANTDGGIMMQVELIRKKGAPTATLGNYEYIPVWRYIHKDASGKATYFALPESFLDRAEQLFPEMPEAAKTKMRTFLTGLRKRI